MDFKRKLDSFRDALMDLLPENKLWYILSLPIALLLIAFVWLSSTILSGEVQHVWDNTVGLWLDHNASMLVTDQVKIPVLVLPAVLLVGVGSAYGVRSWLLLPQNSMIETMAEVTKNLEIVGHDLTQLSKPHLIGTPEYEATLEHALRRMASTYRGDVFRAHILIPDPADPNWLMWLTGYNYPPEAKHGRYFIGKSESEPDSRRGVAGEAFRLGKPFLCTVNPRTYRSRCRAYIPPNKQVGAQIRGVDPHDPLLYKSFIAVPISGEILDWQDSNSKHKKTQGETPERAKQVLAVICMDSRKRGTFFADPLRELTTVAKSPQGPFLRIIYSLLIDESGED